MKIENINLGSLAENKAARPEKKATVSFDQVLKDSISKVGELEKDANNQIEKLTKMETQDVHNTMIAMEKADLSYHLMMQVRNKIISAYEEIMRMQV
ncbi:MAG TPA: flagellar hook-basal body complex protein FliE [Syntrophorhabdaceae bacterium]|jgi:flagellar hook-basal body complex protein FliE